MPRETIRRHCNDLYRLEIDAPDDSMKSYANDIFIIGETADRERDDYENRETLTFPLAPFIDHYCDVSSLSGIRFPPRKNGARAFCVVVEQMDTSQGNEFRKRRFLCKEDAEGKYFSRGREFEESFKSGTIDLHQLNEKN